MSSLSEWDTLAGAFGLAYALALLRLRADLGNLIHLLLFSVVLLAGSVVVVQGLSSPDLEVRLLRFRLSPVGKALEWSAGVAVTILTALVLDRPLVAVALGVAVGYMWRYRGEYYAELRDETERLETSEASARPENA
ncbi:hypothetical protein M0R89_12625 [Halorussus limi]|uniref:Uncharacterized protein n=1 Tax=Halorussus limi TaxID=2938695 RepID=A0A8U0HR56_9EURY|nr:hypothetical protein [Halorussus limi]UPV73387.1 hypothetical protein M0R89_12625 [Halorussus limi]